MTYYYLEYGSLLFHKGLTFCQPKPIIMSKMFCFVAMYMYIHIFKHFVFLYNFKGNYISLFVDWRVN